MSTVIFSILVTLIIYVILISLNYILDIDLGVYNILICIISLLVMFVVCFFTNKYIDNHYVEDKVVEDYPLLSIEESKYINVSGGKTNAAYVLYKDTDGEINIVNLSNATITSDGKGPRYTKYLRKCKFIYKYVNVVNID